MSDLASARARARAFVEQAGPDFARALAAALEDPRAAGRLGASALATGEGALRDPLAPEAPADLATTAVALELLSLVGRLDAPAVERLGGYLRAQQRPDGGFGPAGDDPDRDVERTAHLLGLAARSPFVRPSTLEAAAALLGARWSVERAQAGRLATLAGYLHALSAFPAEWADEALQWCGRELERGFRDGRFAPLPVARVFLLCEAYALPGARLDAGELCQGLLAAQREDGAFEAPGEAPVLATLHALAALTRLRPHEQKTRRETDPC